jgi:putative ABC transport system permease protein
MKNAELGFGKEHRVIFSFDFRNEVDVLKNMLLSNTSVINVSNTSAVPGRNTVLDDNVGVMTYEGNEYSLTRTTVDEGYLKTLDLELVEGRFFEKDRFLDNYLFGDDNPNKNYRILLNETAVKTIGLVHPIGAKLRFERLDRNLEVIGVLKDFHLNSLNNPIIPMYFSCFQKNNQIIANISSTDMASTIQFIESEVEKITGNKPSITFLDDEFERQYRSDDKFAELVGYFATLAILIA